MSNQRACMCDCCEQPCFFIAARCPGLTTGAPSVAIDCAEYRATISIGGSSSQVITFAFGGSCYTVSSNSPQVPSPQGLTVGNLHAQIESCNSCAPVVTNCTGIYPPNCLQNYAVMFTGMNGCISTGSTNCCCKVPSTIVVPVVWIPASHIWAGAITVSGMSTVCGLQACNSNVNFSVTLACATQGAQCAFTITLAINSGVGGGGIFRKAAGPCLCPTGGYATDPGSNGLRFCAASPNPNACHIDPSLFGNVSVT